MKIRIALAAGPLSLIAAGSAFAGEAPQAVWPELDAPIARNITLSPALTAGDVSTIASTAQLPWPELERGG